MKPWNQLFKGSLSRQVLSEGGSGMSSNDLFMIIMKARNVYMTNHSWLEITWLLCDICKKMNECMH